MKRAYYQNNITSFLEDDNNSILGQLTKRHSHALEEQQKNAWLDQINILKNALYPLGSEGYIFFEFAIPRMGKRVDNVLIMEDSVFVIEFKVGAKTYDKHAIEQVLDYAVDLQNFHEGSHNTKLFPLLIATEAPLPENQVKIKYKLLFDPIKSNKETISQIINACLSYPKKKEDLDPQLWASSIYKPTPTIIEAAQALYKGHNVKEISRSDAGAINLDVTTNTINRIIDTSKRDHTKSICFVTGVPGAGKTLAGLNIANERTSIDKSEHAVFLSGNGPLVKVLREALTRDEVITAKSHGRKITKKEAANKANAFIQNIHHFRDDALTTNKPPIEKVVVFDEAQRAWNQKQTTSFMHRKKGQSNFNMSEPHFLIDVMNRHDDWCTIICLIGGGQEINVGEAGLEEWIISLKNYFPDWHIHYSNLIIENNNYLQSDDLKFWLEHNATAENELHLSVSVRSFRSEKISEFVQAILDVDIEKAKELFDKQIKDQYPIKITRNFLKAKKWLNKHSLGSERSGMVASSGAYRLKPYGINVKNKIDAPIWFLNDREDVRSSYFHEDIATEFDIQGLELDWVCVCWDGDFYLKDNEWKYRKFKGTKWQNIHNTVSKKYLLNAYRVLLTRARQGMIIFIPNGEIEDKTRLPEYYDVTFEYLKCIGIEEI